MKMLEKINTAIDVYEQSIKPANYIKYEACKKLELNKVSFSGSKNIEYYFKNKIYSLSFNKEIEYLSKKDLLYIPLSKSENKLFSEDFRSDLLQFYYDYRNIYAPTCKNLYNEGIEINKILSKQYSNFFTSDFRFGTIWQDSRTKRIEYILHNCDPFFFSFIVMDNF